MTRINLEQARKRAKERVRAGEAATLADAQRDIARELGYPSWPQLVRATGERATAERLVKLAADRGEAWCAGAARRSTRSCAPIRGSRCHLGVPPASPTPRRPTGRSRTPPLFYVARSRDRGRTPWPPRATCSAAAPTRTRPAARSWTNLSIACSRGDAPLVALLLEAGADAERQRRAVPRGRAGRRGLRAAPARGRRDGARDERAPPRAGLRAARSRCGYCSTAAATRTSGPHGPPLHHAVARGRSPAFVRLLVERGANLAARDRHGPPRPTSVPPGAARELAETSYESSARRPSSRTPHRALQAIATGGAVDGRAARRRRAPMC